MSLSNLTRRDLGTAAGATLIAGLAGCGTDVEQNTATTQTDKAARPWPYLIGADVSWIPEDEALGATYFENGVQRDPFDILRDAGFNAIKARLFVDPTRGYSKDKPGGPWCDLPQMVKFAKRIRDGGFHTSVTIHYSDDWTNPERQDKPHAWADLPFTKLVDAVKAHTVEAMQAMTAAGATPDMVVLGNEITFGMLWPEGRLPATIATGNPVTDARQDQNIPAGAHDRFAAIMKAAIAGVRETAPDTKIVLHNHLGRHWEIVQDWMDNLLSRDVRFDCTGFSCYQQMAQGNWEHTFEEFPKRYPDHGFIALEYSSRKRYVNDIVHAQPHGWGSFIWEPIRHQEAIFTREGVNAGGGPRPDLLAQGLSAAEAPGSTAQAAGVPHEPEFDHAGGRYDAIPEFLDLYRNMARDYGLKA